MIVELKFEISSLELDKKPIDELIMTLLVITREIERRYQPITMHNLLMTPGIGKVKALEIMELLKEHGLSINS
mgnify:CR=1 FL=1